MTSQAFTRRAVFAILAGGLAVGQGAAAAEPSPIEIAVLPFLSTRLMAETYEPMRADLEQRLGRPTYLVSAPDFRSFATRTQAGEYGLLFTAPHFGRLAEVEAGYRPLLQWKSRLCGVFLVKHDSRFHALADLRGETVGAPDRLAVITMLGEEALAAAGASGVRVDPLPSHNAALLSVLHGEAAAALVSANVMKGLAPDMRDRLRLLASTVEMDVALVIMAGPRLSRTEADALAAALLAFASSESGQAFLARTGYDGIVPVPPGALAAFDRFLPQLRRLLAQSGGGR